MTKFDAFFMAMGGLLMAAVLVAISFISLPLGLLLASLVALPLALKGLVSFVDWASHRLGGKR